MKWVIIFFVVCAVIYELFLKKYEVSPKPEEKPQSNRSFEEELLYRFSEGDPAFTEIITPEQLFEYLNNTNAVTASGLKNKHVLIKGRIAAVQVKYMNDSGGKNAPCLVFGDKGTFVSATTKQTIQREILAFTHPDDLGSQRVVEALKTGDDVTIIGQFHLNLDNQPTELRYTDIVRVNGAYTDYMKQRYQ